MIVPGMRLPGAEYRVGFPYRLSLPSLCDLQKRVLPIGLHPSLLYVDFCLNKYYAGNLFHIYRNLLK